MKSRPKFLLYTTVPRRPPGIAGLDVKRIINEPTAAALAYGVDKEQLSQEEIEKMMAGSWGEAPAEPLQQPPSASSEPADQLTQTKPAASEPAMQTPASVQSGNPSGGTMGGYVSSWSWRRS